MNKRNIKLLRHRNDSRGVCGLPEERLTRSLRSSRDWSNDAAMRAQGNTDRRDIHASIDSPRVSPNPQFGRPGVLVSR